MQSQMPGNEPSSEVATSRSVSAERCIVIAEDDLAVQRLITHHVSQAGFLVYPCADGLAALNRLQELGEGMLLADWEMPGMDGLALCRAVRELEEMQALRPTHIILLTGHTNVERLVEAFEAGANDYMTKPYHKLELLARLHAGERMQRMMRELLQQRIETHRASASLFMLNQRLERLASTDTLTGLSNRRAVFERFEQMWEYSRRNNAALGCLMLDVDRFKSVNDTYGHQAGDAVLATVAKVLRKSLRSYDVCGRFGGEEFIVICPDVTRASLQLLGERIREAVAKQSIHHAPHTLRVTISVGGAYRLDSHGNPDALTADADAQLYHAKETGRNRVCIAGLAAGMAPSPAANQPVEHSVTD